MERVDLLPLSMRYVLPGVCLFVCLSVCPLSTSRISYWIDLHENVTRDVSLNKKIPNFESHPGDSDPDELRVGEGLGSLNALVLLVLIWLAYHNVVIIQLPSKFHGHFAIPLKYVISLICWFLGCVRLLNHIYLTSITFYRSKIPLRII